MWLPGAIAFFGAFLVGHPNSATTIRSKTVLSYQILGLPPEEEDEQPSTITEVLRHLDITLELDQQSHEEGGSVSLAGSDWGGSTVLADFVTNPASGIDWNDCTVVELGSGLGKGAIAAGLMGARVTATDASSTSLKLIRQNVEKYHHLIDHPIQVMSLLWGDEPALEATMSSPDIVMASDVVYYRSNRETLRATIESLCSRPGTRVILAHQWRVNPRDDEVFFQSFADRGFEVDVVTTHLLPPLQQRRDSEGRTPVAIFMMRRKCD